jgi:hypothetical protein
LRLVSGSWLVSAAGHLIYNLSVIVALALLAPGGHIHWL